MTAAGLGAILRGQFRAPGQAVQVAAVVLGGLAILTAFTARTAFQDAAGLLDGYESPGRWHAFVADADPDHAGKTVPSLVLAKGGERLSLNEAARARLGKDVFFVATAPAPKPTPDESRILRSDKGARVRAEIPSDRLPPRGFSAGSILERQSLLGPRVVGGEARIRTAFSKVTQSTRDAVTVAMNFKLQGAPKIPTGTSSGEDRVMLASLKPSVDDTNALGYAAADPQPAGRASSLFEKILKETPQAFIPPVDGKDHAWAATALPDSAYTPKEQTCLANGVYFEARGESTMGQAAVAQVILNRVRNPSYPNSICGVVYQNKNWRNRCQFSFACDGARDRIRDAGAYAHAKRVADQVTKGEIWINEVGSATHYHAAYVRPRWARAMERVDRIGEHIFYRTYNGGL